MDLSNGYAHVVIPPIPIPPITLAGARSPSYFYVQASRMSSRTDVAAPPLPVKVTRYWMYLPFGLPMVPPSVAAVHPDHVPSGLATSPVRVSTRIDVPGGTVVVQSMRPHWTDEPASRIEDSNVPEDP